MRRAPTAAPHKETAATVRPTHARARDDNKKSNAPVADAKRTMDNLAASDTFENKEGPSTDKPADNKDESHSQLSSAVVSSTQDEGGASSARTLFDADMADASDDEAGRRKKKKEELPKETVKSTQPPRGTAARVLAGTKPPGPASKTGAVPLGKNSQGASAAKPTATGPAAGKNNVGPVKTAAVTQGKTAGTNKGSVSAAVTPSKGPERKSPDDTPKPNPTKELMEVDSEETKAQESSSPKVPPLKIVIPGGVVVGVGSAGTQQEGDPRPAGKGRGSAATLPYVMPCSTEGGADSNDDDKKTAEEKRILRSHRTTDDKDKEDRSPPPASGVTTPPATAVSAADLVPPSRVVPTTQEETLATPTVTTTAVATSANGSSSWSGSTSSNELHPRKRKIRASKESHSKEPAADVATSDPPVQHHSNPYQQYIDIRRQIERRQKSLFPVQPKPPQGFKDYLMNRGTYLLQKNIKPMPPVNPPATLPAQMRDQYCKHEKDRHHLKIQHIIEKEKLVLSVEQEILRVHGRAARALANQALPFSACTILRDKEVYNAITPEQEEKERNAQRSRYNGRLFLSWLQDVDDKWEKIKEGMVRRHHTEAETLHAVQKMQWEWRLKEFGLCDYKSTPKIEPSHVPQVHVSDDFDLLPA